MPTSPRIYASTQVAIDETVFSCLETHLQNQVAPNRFCCSDDSALCLLEPRDRDFDIDELMTATTVIEARPCTPYYGPKYERGDWPELCAIIEFLRKRIPQSKIWYGVGGTDELNHVTPDWLDEMWEYWAYNGCRPYDDKSGRTKRWTRSRASGGFEMET